MVEEVVVSAGANLNLAGGEVKEVSISNPNNSDRITITIQNYDGKINVNQEANANGTNNLITVNLKNSNPSELNVTGGENCNCLIEGDKNSKVEVVNVNGASKVTMSIDATDVKVAEGAEKASVRIYSDVENVVVEADNCAVALAASAKVENAKVDGDNVKLSYAGSKIENAEINGTGSVMVYAPITEAPKPTATPTPTEIPRPEGEVIGNEDCSTGWWTAHSDTYKVEEGETETITFYNYTNGQTNYNNFLVVLQNIADAHAWTAENGYWEYAVLRADNFGWGDGYATATLSSNWNWDTFTTDMNGAKVVLSVTNNGSTADVVANITTVTGKSYYQKYTGVSIYGDLYYCLTVEGGCLIIPDETGNTGTEETPDTPEVPEGTLIGSTSFDSTWWTEFSDAVTVGTGQTASITFKNYTNGNENWNNFLVVLNNVAGDKEYAVLRTDNYGWLNGDFANAVPDSNKACNWNWDTLKTDMNGATVVVSVTNNGTTADVVANVTTTTGATYYQKYTGLAIDGDLTCRLTVDGSYLVIQDTVVTPETPVEPEETPEEIPDTGDTDTKEPEVEYEIPAGTVIGAEDCSTGWWTVWSEGVKVKAGESKTITFKNYTKGEGNYQNFIVILKNVPGFETGYKEYAVVRADNWGWGTGYDGIVTPESNWDWSNDGAVYRADMNGATVQLTITNYGTTADILADITTTEGKEYFQNYKGIVVDGEYIYYCLSVDSSYLVVE